MRILHLTLHRQWFAAILSGRKTVEYRSRTDYWARRLEDRDYDLVRFRNGYASDAPTMDVEWRGLSATTLDGLPVYAISLGAIVGRDRCEDMHDLFAPRCETAGDFLRAHG